MDRMNKKGFVMTGMLAVIGVLILFYIILYLPFFDSLRRTVNYFLIVILWVLLQVAIIYLYFIIAKYSVWIFKKYRKFLKTVAKKMQKFVIVHT